MSANKDLKDQLTQNATLTPLIWLSCLIVALWLCAWLLLYIFLPDWSIRGQFGDMFGAINSLFSGMAFAGIIYTILLQRKELSLQRKELELTRIQLERSANAQEKSEEALSEQVESQRRTQG